MEDPTPIVDAPSKPPQRIRRTRIAVSVFFGVVTVALCALWVRSYWRIDYIRRTDSTTTTYGYRQGVLCFASRKLLPRAGRYHGWVAGSLLITSQSNPYSQFGWAMTPQSKMALVPFWLPTFLCCLAATTHWMQRPTNRFSLRTLLIVTTLVAVALGIGVWLVR